MLAAALFAALSSLIVKLSMLPPLQLLVSAGLGSIILWSPALIWQAGLFQHTRSAPFLLGRGIFGSAVSSNCFRRC